MAELLSDRLFIEIEQEINAIGIGEKLPSERVLATKYNVSRNVVREVLKRFSDQGTIDIIPGSGARKSDRSKQRFAESLEKMLLNNGTTLADIVEARETLETQVFILDMQRADAEDMERLWDIFNKLENAVNDPVEYYKYDIQFHIALAEASKNSMFSFLVSSLYEITDRQLFLITRLSKETIRTAQIEHRGLLEAITSKDEARIREIAHIHFTDILALSKKG